MENNKEELIKAILKKSFNDGKKLKLPCPEALKIARQLSINPLEIARICNKRNIRFCQCQLGCFK